MATRFEIALHGSNPASLRAAAEEALDEIDRIEAQLSIYRASSSLSRINSGASSNPVRVEPGVFRFLQRARQLSLSTGGAFDITAAPLFKAWGFIGGTGNEPNPQSLAEALECVGWHNVLLNESDFSVHFQRPGVLLDPGAIGKGYALDCATEVLRDAGVECALLHGGTSTICAIGHPPDADAWSVALPDPPEVTGLATPPRPRRVVQLLDSSLSVSAEWGKCFVKDGRRFGHVIDPRCGQPVMGASMAAVVAGGGTESDALSTALLVLGKPGISCLKRTFPQCQSWVE